MNARPAALRGRKRKLDRLDAISGVGQRTIEIFLAEIGIYLSRFPTAGHLASSAGLCPGNMKARANRRLAGTRKGDVWLRVGN